MSERFGVIRFAADKQQTDKQFDKQTVLYVLPAPTNIVGAGRLNTAAATVNYVSVQSLGRTERLSSLHPKRP